MTRFVLPPFDFIPNFDETEKEPSVLPVKIPNLLVNGSEGIAVGITDAQLMHVVERPSLHRLQTVPRVRQRPCDNHAHGIADVIDATKAYMLDENITTRELMRYMKGPDFPTGGIVINQDELPTTSLSRSARKASCVTCSRRASV